MRPLAVLATLALWTGTSGCYTMRVETEPVGAMVAGPELGGQSAPTEVRLPPFASRELTVSATGYRSLTFDLRWRPLGWLRRSHRTEVRLVPEHGPPGTAR